MEDTQKVVEMKTKRWLPLLMVIIFLAGNSHAIAAPSASSVASMPWKVQLLKGAETTVNLSTAFVGANEIPMLGYAKTGSYFIYFAFRATPARPGNCGLNNAWYCNYAAQTTAFMPSTLSAMATERKTDTFLVGWAFSNGEKIRVFTIEYKNDMTFVASRLTDVVSLATLGGSLVGAPSLQIRNGKFFLAFTVLGNDDFWTHTLYYVAESVTANTTCQPTLSHYFCSPVDQSLGQSSMGAPSFQLASDGTTGMAYFKAGTNYGLMFAYIRTGHANCQSGSAYFRCISIFANVDAINRVGSVVKAAVGKTPSARAIAFTLQNATANILMHATFVGSGGNCGDDLNNLDVSVPMWKCNLVTAHELAQRSFSITIDPQGYPVIAYEDALADVAPVDLYLAYPNARLGLPGLDWVKQYIDGYPDTIVSTGGQVSLSLNSGGLGFIGYLQEDYPPPDLKIAWQWCRVALPLIKR